jgi:ABC-type uncharacterized transport system substrate-binding protein
MRRLGLAAIVLCLAANAASAHPHVWTDMRSALMVNDKGLITGIRIEWTFDEGYATYALEGLDVNNDGVYDPEEIRPLTEENIKALKESSYFGFMRFKGAIQPQGAVTNYAQTYTNNRLNLFFELPLATPIDPKTGAFTYKIYDPDFFISFDYVKDEPVELEGALPTGCTWQLEPLLSDEELEKKRDFLAQQGLDWKPEQQEDFGALFAQPVSVTCAS